MNELRMSQESKRFATECDEFIAILEDRYQDEMTKATKNIKEEVKKAKFPYSTLTTIDLKKKSNNENT